MTPYNMVGMAKLKGLDVIAVTDHNSALNLPQVMEAAQALSMEVIPGLEVTSKEDVHILAYFYTLEEALAFAKIIDDHLPEVENQPDLFGRQLVMGEDDTVLREEPRLLVNATDFSVEQLCALIRHHHGIPVPAHINRGSNGMIGALGLMPMLPEHPVVEVSLGLACPAYATKGRLILHSSDAHRLESIQERVFALEVGEATARGVLLKLEAAFS